jgi:hypothetical protein
MATSDSQPHAQRKRKPFAERESIGYGNMQGQISTTTARHTAAPVPELQEKELGFRVGGIDEFGHGLPGFLDLPTILALASKTMPMEMGWSSPEKCTRTARFDHRKHDVNFSSPVTRNRVRVCDNDRH